MENTMLAQKTTLFYYKKDDLGTKIKPFFL